MSESKRSRRNGDEELPSTRSRSDSQPSSSSKRKSKRNDPDRDGGFNPVSTSYSSTSQTPHPGMAAPSVASSYATANTHDSTSFPSRPPDLYRNESMKTQRGIQTDDGERPSGKKGDSDRRRDRSSSSDRTKTSSGSKRTDKEGGRRSSKREDKPKRTESERALDNHDASLIQNQFPGEFPSNFAEPYRPPGLAADYYGDHGESVAFQPGVRPNPPSIIVAADQAHLHEATIEAAPPPEPSSLGQVGAAASFYAGTSDLEDTPSKPSKPAGRPNLNSVQEPVNGQSLSPRSSPGPEGRPGPGYYGQSGIGSAALTGAGIGAGVGAAAEYFSTQANSITGQAFSQPPTSSYSQPPTSGYPQPSSSSYPQPSSSSYSQPPTSSYSQLPTSSYSQPQTPGYSEPPTSSYIAGQNTQPSFDGSTRPPWPSQQPSSGSNMPAYGAPAAGLAAAGAAAYYADHHTTAQHESMQNSGSTTYGMQDNAQFSGPPQGYQSHTRTQQKRRRRGPFGKLIDFFQDQSAVAEYEAYTEAIGVCKYCFDPNSSSMDAPRKHHYNPRYSGGRYGSSTRVDKLNRYSSDEERRRRSNGKKWIATGLAGYGLAKMSENMANKRNDFDDTYSVQSGKPIAPSRVSFAEDKKVSTSRKKKYSSRGDSSRQDSRMESDVKIRKDRRMGELYEERTSRRRRDSSASDGFSKGAAISTGVAAAGLAAATTRRKRSDSPKKRYYSKRVSPNHSYVDLSATQTGVLGLGSFFSSPSANQRRGKKSKGFFNFNNASSSSSDADLAFGAGSVRRKQDRREDGKRRDDGNVNAELLGLAAAGAALAAEGDRQERKGKRRADLMVVKESCDTRSRRHNKRRTHSPAASATSEENDDWVDASDNESSVDSALAYGGRISARQSRESFGSNDGTDKWAWRWNNNKNPRKKPSQDLRRFDPVAAGLAGAAVGATVASYGQSGRPESTASLQSMQQLYPVPTSDPNVFDVTRTSEVSPAPMYAANSSSAQLEHPQPIPRISPAVYTGQTSAPPSTSHPTGPPVFSRYSSQPPMTESPKQIPAEMEFGRSEPEKAGQRRRNSSPTKLQDREEDMEIEPRRRASTRDSVKFDLTQEQTEKEERARDRERRRARREQRKAERQAEGTNQEQEADLERERDSISRGRRSSADVRTAREMEIDRELKRLYEEDRKQAEARKSRRSGTWPVAEVVGAGVAVAAAVAAADIVSTKDEPEGEREERKSRLKSSMKKSTSSRSVEDARSDSQQRRIAKMAAARVKSTPSPVHENYASYFVPPELADNVKEHNFASRHRDDPSAQIVEVAPQRKDTFPEFLYRPFGIDPEDDPKRYPWPVPLLDLIEPTPPVSVRGDASPVPARTPEPQGVAEKKQKRSSSVTWGEHKTHEYEVITPLSDRDEFVSDTGTATYESSQPAIDLAERTHSEVEPELSEPVTVKTHGKSHAQFEKEISDRDSGDAGRERESKPNYGHDLEFAAVLAAGAAGAGFDPNIIVDDPTFHRRDSPPGSNDAEFYQSPFAETVSDLGTFGNYSVPAQRGFVEGELPPTPANDKPKRMTESAYTEQTATAPADREEDAEPRIPGGFSGSVFDYLEESSVAPQTSVGTEVEQETVETNGDKAEERRRKKKNRATEVDLPPSESSRSQDFDTEAPKDPKRSSTFDDAAFDAAQVKLPESVVSYASDPERSEEKKKSNKRAAQEKDRINAAAAMAIVDKLIETGKREKKLALKDDDYYGNVPPISASEPGIDTSRDSKKSRRKSKRDSEIFDDSASVASTTDLRDGGDSGKKKKSKGDSPPLDDDTMSVASLPADLNGDKSSRKSKDKKSGGFFGLFSTSKSDGSSTSKRSSKEVDSESRNGRDAQSEDADEPKRKTKRKSRDKDSDDISSVRRRSRSDSQSLIEEKVRQQSPEDEFVSSEEAVRETEQAQDKISFLGARPEMPTVRDGASGSIAEQPLGFGQDLPVEPFTGVTSTIADTARSRSVSSRTTPPAIEEPQTPYDQPTSPLSERDHFRQRHLAEIRTSDILSSPAITSSPTAVPLHFRRLPVSPGNARSASVGSVSVGSASAQTPASPLTTPRTRQGRPTSTEFRNSREFRPLFLVERHSSTKPPEPDIEETYPSLPSSRTSSAHPSMENLRGDDFADQYVASDSINPLHMHDRRDSYSYWQNERPKSPDYLDSRTATPTATEFPKEVKREKPKYEFHSPSELLQDPSRYSEEQQEQPQTPLSPMVLPSVGSPAYSEFKDEPGGDVDETSSSARSRRSTGHEDALANVRIAMAAAAAAAAAFAVSRSSEQKDVEKPVLREIEVSNTPQTVDDGFALQPVSSRKAKKDKKKNGKTLDFAEVPEETTSSCGGDGMGESANVSNDTSVPQAEQKDVREVPREEIPANFEDVSTQKVVVSDVLEPESKDGTPIEDITTESAPAFGAVDKAADAEVAADKAPEEEEWAFNTKKSKKDEKGENKRKDSALVSQPIEPEVTESPRPDAESNFREETTDRSLDAPEKDITAPEVSAFPEDQTDLAADLDEKVSHTSFPFDESTTTEEPQSQLSPLEAAFAKAQAVRGTAPHVTEEEAFTAFLPHSSIEIPIHQGRLDTIEEVSKELLKDDLLTSAKKCEEAQEDEILLSRSKSKKDKKSKKSKKAKEVEDFGVEPEPAMSEDKDRAIAGEPRLNDLPTATEAYRVLDEARNPFGDDYELSRKAVEPLTVEEAALPADFSDPKTNPLGGDYVLPQNEEVVPEPIVEDDKTREPQPEEASALSAPSASRDLDEPVEEFSWAPTSKKDKKSKKGRAFALISEKSTSFSELASEAPDQPTVKPQAERPDDYFKAPSTKKSKKNKKNQVLDWAAEDVTSSNSEQATELSKEERQETVGSDMAALNSDTVSMPQQTVELPRGITDDFSAPLSKMDKKEKKEGQALDWAEAAPTSPAEEHAEPLDDAPEENITEEQAQLPEEAVADFSAPKSKKEKKKKKKGQAFNWAEEVSTPQSEQRTEPLEDAPKEDILEEPTPLSQEETAEFSTPVSEQEKKKKKKKKKKGQAFDWAEESLTPQSEESTEIPVEAQLEVPVAVAEDLDGAPTKKSKKVKEKGKRQSAFEEPEETLSEAGFARDGERALATEPLEEQAFGIQDESLVPVAADAHEAEKPSHEVQESELASTQQASEPSHNFHASELDNAKLAPEPKSGLQASELDNVTMATEPQSDLQASKLANEDEASVLRDTRPVSVPHVEPQHWASVPILGEEQQVSEPTGAMQQHEAAVPDVEHQRWVSEPGVANQRQASEPTGARQQTSVPGAFESEFYATSKPAEELTAESVNVPDEEAASLEAPTQVAEEQIDEFAWDLTKKSKKDKKSKQRQSILDELHESTEASPMPSESEQNPPASIGRDIAQDDIMDTSEIVTPAEEPSNEADAFSWAPTKKNKKDKKKKKSLAFADETSTPDNDDYTEARSMLQHPTIPTEATGEYPVDSEPLESDQPTIARDTVAEDKMQRHMDNLSSLPPPPAEEAFVEAVPQNKQQSETREHNLQSSARAKEVEPESTDKTLTGVSEQLQEEPEEFSSAKTPKKKGKKDKKKRGSLLAMSDPVTPQSEQEPSRIEEIQPIIEEPVGTLATEPVEEANEDEWAFSTKKSKKDKKKKKSTLTPLEELVTPAPEEAQEETQNVERDTAGGLEPEGNDQTMALKTEEEPTREIVEPEQEAIQSVTLVPEQEEVGPGSGKWPLEEAVEAMPAAAEEEDSFWAPASKQSSKDKKKKKRNFSVVLDEPVEEEKVYEPMREVEAYDPMPEDKAFEPEASVEKHGLVQPSPVVEPEAIADPEVFNGPEAVAEDDAWASPNKRSKKDEKKKDRLMDIDEPKDQPGFVEPETEIDRRPVVEPRIVDEAVVPVKDQAIAGPEIIDESKPIAEDDTWAPITMKGTKDKKKGKAMELPDEPRDEPGLVETDADIDRRLADEPEMIAEPVAPIEDQAMAQAGMVDEPELIVEEDEAAAITKKGKKKKRQSTFDFDAAEEPSQTEAAVAPELQQEDVGREEVVEPSAITESPAPEPKQLIKPEEDAWGLPTKKSKKDKKKKRQSTLDEYGSTPSEPATPAEPQEAEPFMASEKTVSGAEGVPMQGVERGDSFYADHPIVAESAPAEADMWTTGKKSKKEKKKKKTLLPWGDDNEVSTDQQTERSTPANELETVAIVEEARALDVSEEPMIMPVEEAADAAELETRRVSGEPESNILAAEQQFDEPGYVPSRMTDLVEEESKRTSESPRKEEDPWSFSTMKKSKKSKKGKKNTTLSDFEAAESPSQDMPVEDVSRDRSFSVPGAFADEPESQQVDVAPEVNTEEMDSRGAEGTKQKSDDVAGEDAWAFTRKPSKKSKNGKKSRQSTSLAFDEPVEPTLEAVEERAGPLPQEMSIEGESRAVEDDTFRGEDESGDGHLSEAAVAGLGTSAIAAAAISHYSGARNEPSGYEIPSQHQTQHESQHSQAMREHNAQHEQALRQAEERSDLPRERVFEGYNIANPAAAASYLEGSPPPSVAGYTESLHKKPEVRPSEPTWSFSNLKNEAAYEDVNRDSGVQFTDSPTLRVGQFHSTARDSGYVPSPVIPSSRDPSTHQEGERLATGRRRRPMSPTSSSEDVRLRPSDHGNAREMHDARVEPSNAYDLPRNHLETPAKRQPSPVDSTTKDRSSKLFNSSPSNRTDAHGAMPQLDTRHLQGPVGDLHRSPSIHGHGHGHRSREDLLQGPPTDLQRIPSIHGHGHQSREDLRALTPSPTRHARQSSGTTKGQQMQGVAQEPHRSIFGPFPSGEEHENRLSPPATPLQTINEHTPEHSSSNTRQREVSDVGSPDRAHEAVQRSGDLQHHEESTNRDAQPQSRGHGVAEAVGVAGLTGAALAASEELRPTSRDEKAGNAKSLCESKSRSTSSKQLRRSKFSIEDIASSSTHDPLRGKGKEAARDMADVYNGYGEFPASPMSPTRPPSVRKRQSMQQIKDLEARLEQLASENRLLANAKLTAEQQLQDHHFESSRSENASQEALELRDAQLREKDGAIERMKEALDGLQQEVARLTEVNDSFSHTHEQRYSQLVDQHAETQQQWQESTRELENLKSQHTELSGGMEEIVKREVDLALAEKDAELERLYYELEEAKAKIRELQQQILVSQSDDIIIARDEDYFDNACQQLCQHVQQWVLRFSKFSDTRVCRSTNEVRDEKVVDRFDNAILDGSDVDTYLGDRVKRRDVFMSVVMTMIWEYIFTRYLFGMDREQRQKLKLLEKNLSEVGPPSAVHRWRAMTLTILSKRETFKGQRASDTEAVVQEIYSTLARFLPPPHHLQGQIQDSLRNVMKTAVDLSIEMRTQRAEYIMLPPLQPEYDTNGDLARKVYFNAALMNERSGETTSNEELESQQAVVRMVLFPLVVKKGSDSGEGDEEIVVCPAQVLVARVGKDKRVSRVVSAGGLSVGNGSVQSFAMSGLDMSNVI